MQYAACQITALQEITDGWRLNMAILWVVSLAVMVAGSEAYNNPAVPTSWNNTIAFLLIAFAVAMLLMGINKSGRNE